MESKFSVKEVIKVTGFKSVYYFEHGKNFYHVPEQHEQWEIVYVDKGEIIAVTNGIGSTVFEGEAIFHEPFEIHTHISNKKVSNNMFVVSFFCDSPAMNFFKKKRFKLDENSKRLLSLFLKEAQNALVEVQHDYRSRKPLDFSNAMFGAEQLMASLLEEFLIKLIRTESGNVIKDSKEARNIAKNSTAVLIEEYLKSKVYTNVTLDELCTHFFIGKSKLSSIFKECTGESPMRYLSILKITEAKKLLRDDVDSVTEIAEKLCYSSVHAFTRAFKDITGFSPTAYKKSIY